MIGLSCSLKWPVIREYLWPRNKGDYAGEGEVEVESWKAFFWLFVLAVCLFFCSTGCFLDGSHVCDCVCVCLCVRACRMGGWNKKAVLFCLSDLLQFCSPLLLPCAAMFRVKESDQRGGESEKTERESWVGGEAVVVGREEGGATWLTEEEASVHRLVPLNENFKSLVSLLYLVGCKNDFFFFLKKDRIK